MTNEAGPPQVSLTQFVRDAAKKEAYKRLEALGGYDVRLNDEYSAIDYNLSKVAQSMEDLDRLKGDPRHQLRIQWRKLAEFNKESKGEKTLKKLVELTKKLETKAVNKKRLRNRTDVGTWKDD